MQAESRKPISQISQCPAPDLLNRYCLMVVPCQAHIQGLETVSSKPANSRANQEGKSGYPSFAGANQDTHQLLSHFSVNNRKIHASLVGILNLLFLEFVGVLNLLMDRFRTVRI